MAFVVKDRVKVTTTTTGTGTITLGAAAAGFQDFSVIGNGNITSYSIVDSVAGTWEVGIGTYTSSGTTLSRTTILESSNGGSLVNFAAGSKDVFVTYPAEYAVFSSNNPGTSGQILASAGANAVPTWVNPPTGTVTSVGGTGSYGGLTLTGTVTTSGNLTLGGTPTGNWPINAATATALQTARTIGGVSFDGTANINLPGVNTAGNQNTTGSAATLASGQSNWSGTGVLGNVVGLLAWKNYGNGHVIFDASQSTTPSGGACNNTNPTDAWAATYPTLMGWNGSTTFGVRVDRARLADSIVSQANSATITASTTAGAASTIVQRDGNGYIFNNYFNSTDNSIASGVTAIIAKQTDNYYRSATAAAVATFISGQSMNIAGSATSLNSSNSIARTGSSGNLNTDFNNTPAGTGRYQGDDAGLANSPGGSWWIYENKRHSNGGNSWGTQVAWGWEDNANRLATRNVQAGSFSAWVYYLNSGNYTSYAPSLTGSGASGTLGIAISGNAGNTSSISNAVGTTYTWPATQYFVGNGNTAPSAGIGLQVFSNDGGGATMAFHRAGAFAVNFGLDNDNVLRIGGWSAGPNLWQLDMSGNNTLRGQFINRYPAPSGTFPVIIGDAGGLPADRGIILQSSSGSSIPLYFTVNSGGTVSGSVIASGGTTAYNTSSDYRMKENIRDVDVADAVNKIMSVRPRVFDWKEEFGGKTDSIGFIAHELQEHAPECVNGEKDRVHSDGAIFPQGVDSSWLIPSISVMLQEHQKVIEQLKAKVAALEGI